MILTLILLFLIFVLIGQYYYSYFGYHARIMRKLPCPPIIPIFGNILSFFNSSRAVVWNKLRKLNDDYYPIYAFWGLSFGLVNIRHPDDAEIILSSMKHIRKAYIYNYLHPWFGTGLLTSTGTKWQQRRKVLTPAFHFNILKEFTEVFIEETERLTNSLQSENGPVVKDIIPLSSEHTLNIICETAMGTSLRGRGEFQFKYRQAVYDMGHILVHRLLRPWLFSDRLFNLTPTGWKQSRLLKILHGFTNSIIGERKRYHSETKGQDLENLNEERSIENRGRRLALLDLLIAASKKNKINDDGIREEVDTFMFEGHDTTAVSLFFTLMLLAEHPEIQERARQEIKEALSENDDKLSIPILQKLVYLERCIKESLRLYPSVPFIARVTSSDVRLHDYLVPRGTVVHVHIYDLHRDPNFWPNPHAFDPDRFAPENIKGRHPYSYIPFSAGPRNCIGQKFAMNELKTTVAQLLHNYYLEPVERLKDIPLLADLVIRPQGPVNMKFIPIKSNGLN